MKNARESFYLYLLVIAIRAATRFAPSMSVAIIVTIVIIVPTTKI